MNTGLRNANAKGALVLCLFAVLCAPVFAQPKVEVLPQATSPAPTVSAVGEAVARFQPDTAVLTFAVEIRNPNTTQAVLVNQRMTKKVAEEIEKSGVATADVAVGNYEMKHVVNTFLPALGTNQPVEFQLEQHGTYLVTSTIVVTIHHIADVAKIISTALGAGVDRIDRVEYEASSLTTVEAELMPKAIKDARQKAEALAHDTGLTLGEPIRVVQLPDTSVSAVVAAGNTVPGQMSPPKIEARLRVRVVYAAKRSSG